MIDSMCVDFLNLRLPSIYPAMWAKPSMRPSIYVTISLRMFVYQLRSNCIYSSLKGHNLNSFPCIICICKVLYRYSQISDISLIKNTYSFRKYGASTKSALHKWGWFEWRYWSLKMLLHSWLDTIPFENCLSNEILRIYLAWGDVKLLEF